MRAALAQLLALLGFGPSASLQLLRAVQASRADWERDRW